jgi:hypothetical protein
MTKIRKDKTPSATFTITIPTTDEPVRTGLLVVRRQSLGTLHHFAFSTINDILQAMRTWLPPSAWDTSIASCTVSRSPAS